MGMYDTFIYKCPNCKEETDAQTKLGDQCLDCWKLGDKVSVPDGFYRLKDRCHNCDFYATVEIYNGIFYMIYKDAPNKAKQEMPYGSLQELGADPEAQIIEIANELKNIFKEFKDEKK